MSWSIEEHIGDCRPFPAQVVVYKGETDECLAYVSGEVADRLKAENAKLRELVRDVYKAAHMLCEAWDGSCSKEADGMSLHSVCPIGDTSEMCVFGKLDDRMRELGVTE